jgi:poly-gamma-glutamate capsule biosynthesis protein CapA/YwtB (metallophosphatase superfamily)
MTTTKHSRRFIITGQSLMRHDLRNGQDPNFLSVVEGVRSADIAFANFEGAVRPPDAELPSEYHPSDAVTLDCLKWMGFNLLSLANNHAFEAAEAGIQYTEELARQKGFTTAGTGATLEEASRAGVLEISGTKIALIAMDTANCQTEKAVAGPGGPSGINPLRAECIEGGGFRLNPEDLSRNLMAIEQAASRVDCLFVSLHEHFWPEGGRSEWGTPCSWKREFSRRCIDAGACAVICHGIPRACPVEIYRDRPIFHSMGNFIFHSRMDCWDEQMIWEGIVVTGCLAESRIRDLRILPIILADEKGRADVPFVDRWFPTLAGGAAAERILDRIFTESEALGTEMQRSGDTYSIMLS